MKNKIIILLSLLSFLPVYLSAQVTIGSGDPPHESAILDLQSSNKGFLGPRVALTGKYDNTTIPDAAPGLLVINTAQPDNSLPEEDRVYPYRFYYWVETGTPHWERFVGHDEIEYWIDQEIGKWSMPQPVMFYLNGTDILSDNRPGIRNFMAGISVGSSKEVVLKDSINHSDGAVQLKPGTLGTIVLKPGIYHIVFAYLFIPTTPAVINCQVSSYFMSFPFYPRDGSGRKDITVYSVTYHNVGDKASHAAAFNFVAPIETTTDWVVRLGTASSLTGITGISGCAGVSGFSLPNRNTFLYITKVGDW